MGCFSTCNPDEIILVLNVSNGSEKHPIERNNNGIMFHIVYAQRGSYDHTQRSIGIIY